MTLVFASANEHKVREISSILGHGMKIRSLREIDILDDIPENENTLEGNALAKARYVHSRTGLDVFADDTGLEVNALGGAPGVHSARFAGESKDPSLNIVKLLSLLEGVTDRRARFRTVIALIIDNCEYAFEGTVEGSIISERRGSGGFGYDPVFVADGYDITFAEMSLQEKNRISHRARAFEKLNRFLAAYREKRQ